MNWENNVMNLLNLATSMIEIRKERPQSFAQKAQVSIKPSSQALGRIADF